MEGVREEKQSTKDPPPLDSTDDSLAYRGLCVCVWMGGSGRQRAPSVSYSAKLVPDSEHKSGRIRYFKN